MKLLQPFNYSSSSADHGISMIEMILATGCFGILALTVSIFISIQAKFATTYEALGVRDDARQYLRELFDCNATIKDQILKCTPSGSSLKLRRANGETILND